MRELTMEQTSLVGAGPADFSGVTCTVTSTAPIVVPFCCDGVSNIKHVFVK
jgi:hypothetical protein